MQKITKRHEKAQKMQENAKNTESDKNCKNCKKNKKKRKIVKRQTNRKKKVWCTGKTRLLHCAAADPVSWES